eukprot:NODE_309_length_10065_cov_0.706101.p2 type:complete len:487 gc:universal NODE_309_length_10065_cov_0.706101:2073-613(-)
MEWEDLKLNPIVVKMIKTFHDKPSMVQKHAIPQFISKKDVLVEACTGSGKTNAFLLPCLHFAVQADDHFGAVIIAPTRELAKQIFGVLEEYCKSLEVECGLITSGSEPIYPKTTKYILVATPKRLISAIISKKLNTRIVEILICDEADRFVDSTFNVSFTNLIKLFPKQRMTALFSATLCKDDFFMQTLVKKLAMRNPYIVRIKSSKLSQNASSPSQLKYQLCYINAWDRIMFLINFLNFEKSHRIVVFVNSSDGVNYLLRLFKLLSGLDPDNSTKKKQLPKLFTKWTSNSATADTNFVGIHGKMKSHKREQVYNQFIKYSEKKQVLFSTDLTSRGIDFDSVDCVIQLDPPSSDISNIFHRGGRTARFDKKGKCIICLDPSQEAFEYTMGQKQIQFEKLSLEIPREYSYLVKLNEFDAKLNSLAKASVISLYEGYKNIVYKYIFDLKKINFMDWCIGCGLIKPVYLKEAKKLDTTAYEKRMSEIMK